MSKKLEELRKKLQAQKRAQSNRNEAADIMAEIDKQDKKYSKIQKLLNSDGVSDLPPREEARTITWKCSRCGKDIESYQRPAAKQPECNDCVIGLIPKGK